jgi:cytochrome o ubiquinol oxidase subunit 3
MMFNRRARVAPWRDDAAVLALGPQPRVRRRFFCFALFWHALDIIWIGVFTIVYLGAH